MPIAQATDNPSMFKTFIVSLFMGLALSTPFTPAAHAQAGAMNEGPGQAVLLEMADAFKRNDRRRVTNLLPQVRGHVLEPWAAYWELRARLDDASSSEVRQFLSRYAGTYQEDRLRNDWLMVLGNRRDWATFETEQVHYRMRDDRELRCYELVLNHQKNPAGFGPESVKEVLNLWRSMLQADDGCTLAAERLLEDRKIKPLEVWRKARLAVENNRPVTARNAVQLVAPKLLNTLKDLQAQPAKFLNQHNAHPRNAVQELVVLALVKLASSDPDEAYKQMQRTWSIHLTTEERHWVWGAIGRQLAMRLDGDALKAFELARSDHDLTDDMLAWKVRAALRAGATPAWKAVESAIMAMDVSQRQEPVWVYWLGRALNARGHKDQAQTLWEGIASVKGFYEQLALDQHQRAHQHVSNGSGLALSHAISGRCGAAGQGNQPGPSVCVWADPPRKPLHHGCAIACGGLWLDAGDAGHRPMDGQKNWHEKFQPGSNQSARHQYRHWHGLFEAGAREHGQLHGHGGSGLQRGAQSPATLACARSRQRPRAGSCDLGREHPVQ